MFKWAIIGTGNIAETVAKEITASGKHSVSCVFSRSGARAERFAEKFGAKSYPSCEQMLGEGDFDCVYIATPHSAHFEYAKLCMNAEKNVLCEKAFTVNAEQTRILSRIAKEKDVFLAEAMWTRFNPCVRKIVQWVKEDKIGKIKSIKASFCVPLSVSKPFLSERVYRPEYAGGALLDLGVYPIAYAHMLLGKPKKVVAKMELKHGVDIEDKIELHYENAVAKLSASLKYLRSYKVVIVGEKGKIISPMFYRPDKATFVPNKGKKEKVECKSGYIYQFDAVAKAIREGVKQVDVITHNDSIEVMEIMDECRRQNKFVYPESIEKTE